MDWSKEEGGSSIGAELDWDKEMRVLLVEEEENGIWVK